VYIITSGAYSDYSIEFVYSTRELAERKLVQLDQKPEKYTYYGNRIEEWELDPKD